MRVLRFLVVSILSLGVLALLGFFVGREILLQMAVARVRAGYSQLRATANSSSTYLQECKSLGVSQSGTPIERLQLRFFSDRQFVAEVVCGNGANDRLVIAQYAVPIFVQKIPGSSGLIYDDVNGGYLAFSLYGRSIAVAQSGGILETIPVADISSSTPSGPPALCSEHGYTCCNPDTETGVGEVLTQASDCPKSCFTSCQQRPVVLSLVAQPNFDPESRVVYAKAGDLVSFTAVVDAPTEIADIRFSFGDGTTQSFTESPAIAEHTFSCSSGRCQYRVTVVLEASDGSVSVDSPLNELQVIVTP